MRPALEVVTRGVDTSGRPLRATAQMFELHDRINDRLGGKFTIVQGSFNLGVSASAGTHDRAGCVDWRSWNLTAAEISEALHLARDNALALFPRTVAQGFDPHLHGTLLSDAPMTPQTKWQVSEYIAGHDMLASQGADTFYRPRPLVTVYHYQGADMALTDHQAEQLANTAENTRQIEAMLKRFIPAEAQRDADDRARDKARSEALGKTLAGVVDQLGELERNLSGDAADTRKAIRKARADLLQQLRDDPATTGTRDDPTPEAVAQARADADK